jgi:hypothetical protein
VDPRGSEFEIAFPDYLENMSYETHAAAFEIAFPDYLENMSYETHAAAFEIAFSDYLEDPSDLTNNTAVTAIALLRRGNTASQEAADRAQERMDFAYAIYSAHVFLPGPPYRD